MRRLLPWLGLWMCVGCSSTESVPSQAIAAATPPRAVDWAELAGFEWLPADLDASRGDSPIPAAILALDGQEVELVAELAPIAWGEDAVRGYVLTRDPNACCVCVLPPFTAWIEITDIAAPEAEQRIFGTTRMRGRLSVGPRRDAYGYVRSLYRLSEARFVDLPWNRG